MTPVQRNLKQLWPKERDTLKALCDLLDAWQAQGKCVYIRHNPYSPFTDRKTGKVRFRKPRASQVGAPDVLLYMGWPPIWNAPLLGTQMFAIETKAPDGELSLEQKAWKKKAERIGMRYLVIRSIDEFLREVRP